MDINLYYYLKRTSLVLLILALFAGVSVAQDVVYSHSFTGGQSYCPGDPQYDDWKTFRDALDSTNKKFLSATVKGSRNPGGTKCSDPTLTRRIAEALRTSTNISLICDGNKWEVRVGCGPVGCANAGDQVELVVGAGNPCNCVLDNTFRVCIGNQNWGGLGTSSCPPPTQTMECIFENPLGNNAAPGGVTAPITSCGSTNDSIAVSIRNAGLNRIANIPVTCEVSGTLGGSPYNQTFTTTIGSASDSVEPFTARQHTFAYINTSSGADLDILLYTALPIDTTPEDDTLRYTFKNVGTPTGAATTNDVTICGTGRATLTATVPAGHEAFWYNDNDELVAVGATAQSPIVPGAFVDSFFVASAKVSSAANLGTDYTGSTSANAGFQGGNMFDIKPKKHIIIEGFDIHLRTTTATKVTIYMKQGTYDGFQTNQGAWTMVGEYDVTAAGLGAATSISVDPIELMPGTYGFYIYASDGMVWTAGGLSELEVEDFDLGLEGAVALRDPFATQLGNTVRWDGEVTYRQICVDGTKAKARVTANPLPVGSSFDKGSLFKGTYDAGTTGQPDIIASPDSICYDIPAPTGYTNSDYGTSSTNWNVSSFSVTTVNGTAIPSTEYSLTVPSGSDDAKLCFFPSSTYTDSTVEIVANVRRLDNNCDSTLKRVMFIAPRPVPMFTNTTVCLGEVTEFSNTSSILSGKIEYLWEFGDGTTSTLTDPAKTYDSAGNYSVKLNVTSDKGYTEVLTQTVIVKEIPNPNFRITNACEGTPLTFQDNSTLPPGTPTYVWDFGDGNGGGGTPVNHLYNTPGIYPVKLTIDVAGCSNSITKYATQAPRSTPDFSFVNSTCDNLKIPFTNSTTAPLFGSVGYVWKFGDGSQASQISPEHVYNTFNTFNVTLVATTDLGCADSITKQVTLLESPKPVFSLTGQSCTNGSISFGNSTNVPVGSTNTYEWDFGDGNSSTNAAPSNTYVSSGMYKIVLKAISTNGCDGEKDSTITINEKPVSDFIANDVCEGEETKFTNGSTITNGTLTYTWDLDDGNPTLSTTNPTKTYASANTYDVSLVSESANGCSDTIVKTVNVFEVPPVDINIASNLTQDGTMLFSTTSTGTGYNYFWNFGDGGQSNQQNPTYKFNFPGTWSVRLTIRTDNGCENTALSSVFVNPLSVDGVDGEAWSVYPNPSTGKFYIKYSGIDVSTLKISDILGKTISVITNNIPSNELEIDLSAQKAGIYFITLTDSNGNTTTQKITLSK